MALKNVAFVGAGGNLGPSILNALLTSPHDYSVTVLSRAESTYTPPSSAALKKVNYNDHASLVEALKGQDAVVSAIATAATADQRKIVDAAVEAGVKRFVPAEYGVDTASPEILERVPFLKPKSDVRDYLIQKEKENGIEWTEFITGPFFDWGLKVGFLGFNLSTQSASFDPKYRSNPFSGSNLSLIGQAVSQALSPSIAPKTANKTLYVRSFTVSQNEILAVLEKVTGKQWKVEENVNFEERVRDTRERLQKGDFSTAVVLLQDAIFDETNWDVRGIAANESLELPKEDLEGTIREIVG